MQLPSSNALEYVPAPTLERFMLNDARVRAIRGPVGSGKTSACIMELVRRACESPPNHDGVRRSKGAVVRNTLPQLKTTCLVSIQSLLGPLVHYKVSDQTIEFRMPGVEADWLLLPLDTPENVERLLSLEITYAWVSEFREIAPQLVLDTFSRCGRYPSKVNVKPQDHGFWYGLVMETNSFSEDSPWYDKLELSQLPSNWAYFVQPGAREPNAENLQNLPSSYYADLIEANTPEWVEQYIDNRITPSLSGQAVFRNSFYSAFHVAQHELPVIPGVPLMIGMDTGRHPAAVIGQLAPTGRLQILAAISAGNLGMELFLTQDVLPLLATERFATNPSYLILDPACNQRSQIGEESVIECCRRIGFVAQPATTNAIAPRLRAVEKFLTASRGGAAAILFDPIHCSGLILAMQARYRYKLQKDGVTLDENEPEKKHPWSDYCLCAGTLVATPTGPAPIETLRYGDAVCVPDGEDRVVAVGTHYAPRLLRLILSDGAVIDCTLDHPFLVHGEETNPCVVRADALTCEHRLVSIEDGVWASGRSPIHASVWCGENARHAEHGSASPSGAFAKARDAIARSLATASVAAQRRVSKWMASGFPALAGTNTTGPNCPASVLALSTSTYGSAQMDPFPQGIKSTTSTETRRTTTSPIWNAWHSARTAVSTCANGTRMERWLRRLHSRGSGPLRGIEAQRGANGIGSTRSGPLRVVRADVLPGGDVYNLTTERTHLYYAAGVLCHNCDALQYLCLGTDGSLRGRVMNQIRRLAGAANRAGPAPSAAGWT